MTKRSVYKTNQNKIMKKFLLSAFVLLATVAAQAQTKSAFVHLKSGAVETIACSDIDSITFESFDLNVKATVIEAANDFRVGLPFAPKGR